MRRLAESDIGEVLLDPVTGGVQLRVYNLTIDLDMEEWQDLANMIHRAAGNQQNQSLLEIHQSQDGGGAGAWLGGALTEVSCPACGQGFAAFLGAQPVECPNCGEPVHTLPRGGRLDA